MSSSTDVIHHFTICNTTLEYSNQLCQVIREAFLVPENEKWKGCISYEDVEAQLQCFPEGQFIALDTSGPEPVVAAMACTLRTNIPPAKGMNQDWWQFIGTYRLTNHVPDGEWLYGAEMAVRPVYQGRGIGTALYNARFDLVKRLNLKGWYAAGMLMGYHRYRDQMTPREYGEKVIALEIHDPTVTMQMNRGFEAWSVMENYLEERPAGNAAVLIVWKNPDYQA